MIKLLKHISLVVFLTATSAQTINAEVLPYQNAELSDDLRAKDLASRMTLQEKIDFVTGDKIEKQGVIGTLGVPRLGIPNFKIEHGPYGFKGWFAANEPKEVGTYFPVSIAQAASWDRDLIYRVNSAMGAEMKASGGHANAGPAMNIIRDPRGGRSFEYFTEDPYLNGQVAKAHVEGLQSQKVMANLKHYACNNQEFNRHTISVKVDERTLREVYLEGFRVAIQDAGAWSVMGAYNKINGVYSCENPFILKEVLRDDWGFKGFVLSDWAGTHSTAPSVNAGLDLEMPNFKWYGKRLKAAVAAGEVKEEQLTLMVENILRGMFWAEAFDEEPSLDKTVLEQPSHLKVAREAAAKGIVLLKNEGEKLPFDTEKIKSIAVIGPNGNYGDHYNDGKFGIHLLQGGGSALVPKQKSSIVTPFEGVENILKEKSSNIKVSYAPGCYAETGCGDIPSEYLTTPDGKQGLRVTYYRNMEFKGEPAKVVVDKDYIYMWRAALPIPEAGNKEGDNRRFSVRWEGELTAPATRKYMFEVRNVSGVAKLYINDKLVADNQKGNRKDYYSQGEIELQKGEKYKIRAEYVKTGGLADMRIGWDYENVEWLNQAVNLAKNSDAVLLTVGLSGDMGETEAGDRNTLNLAPAQEKLINEVAKVNPNTAVVLIGGSAITTQNWMDNVPSILTAWYPGQQGGNGIADVVFGDVNPSAKLPITFPLSLNQYPDDFHSLETETEYKEGVFVGYKYFDKHNKDVLFPFGYGLSYTTFELSNFKVTKVADDKVWVSIDVKNTGQRDGAQVIQVYVGDTKASVERPEKELRAFKKVELEKRETKTAEFELDRQAFVFWDVASDDWKLESGEFVISVGTDSQNLENTKTIKL